MSLARDVTTVGSATLLSRLLAFIRDAGIAAALGAGGLSDAFFAALQIPNLFRRLLAEGALNGAFVPMWLRIRGEGGPQAARRFGETVLGLMLVALGSLAVVCAVFAFGVIRIIAPGFDPVETGFGLAVGYLRLGVPYIVIAGMVAVGVAVLNAEKRVFAASFGLVIYNAVVIVAVAGIAVAGLAETPLAGTVLSGALVLAGVGQLLLIAAAVFRLPAAPRRPRFERTPDTRRFFALAVPGAVAAGIPQLTLMAGTMIASSSDAALSWLYYANRLYELPLGVISVAIASVMAPAIATGVRGGDRDLIAGHQASAFEIAVGLSVPAAIAFALLADDIVRVLFERGAFDAHDTVAVGAALAAVGVGLPGHAIEKVLGAVSFAHEESRLPMMSALTGLAASVVAALVLFPIYGHVGVAAAIALAGWIGAAVLAAGLLRRGWLTVGGAFAARLARIVGAAVLMGVALVALRAVAVGAPASFPVRAALLAVQVVGGLAVYGIALQALGVVRLTDVLAAVRRR
jgi:putative peptidoglycan lipid II flippase